MKSQQESLIQIIQAQIGIPVVSSMKKLEDFCESDLKVCVVQDIHLSLLESMLDKLHAQERYALVHIDMIHGIANDEYGTQFICQKLRSDGIISTKSKIIEATKKSRKLAIQRMFLIDSKSVERGIEAILKSQPDILELMPAIAFNIIPSIKVRVNLPLLGGGLIKSLEEIQVGLTMGFSAFTLGDLDLCIKVKQK